MAQDNTKNNSKTVVAAKSMNGMGQVRPCTESFNKIGELRRSVQGMAQLKPQAAPKTSQSTGAPQPTGTASNPAGNAKK